MDEQLIFTSGTSGTVGTLHSLDQSNLRQCQTETRFSSCIVKRKYLFVAQSKKALIQVYNLNGSNKRESVEQRLPVPEVLQTIECVDEDGLLLGATDGGKLYIWQLASGNLLNVKAMAHYQGIVKIRSICNGKYIVTAGNDSRLIFWQTMDLVQNDEPKPLFIIHDHTLPITDFVFSNTLGHTLEGKLYTVSKDMSLRCYQISVNHEPYCISTFTFSSALNCISLDPADRAIYVGTDSGVIQVPVYYTISKSMIVNLLQHSKTKIYSIVETIPGSLEIDSSTKEKMLLMGQISCMRLGNSAATLLATSLDGSLLVIGDSTGKCTVTEIFSNQPLKEVRALSTNDSTGAVTNLILHPITQESESLLEATKATKPWKFINLQRAVVDRKTGINDVHVQFHDTTVHNVQPVSNFESYLDSVAAEEHIFHQTDSINSTVHRVGQLQTQASAAAPAAEEGVSSDKNDLFKTKDKQIAQLNGTVASLTDAYKELRKMHEDLMKEHQELLNKTKGESK